MIAAQGQNLPTRCYRHNILKKPDVDPNATLGTRGFLVCGGNFRAGHYKDLTETGNRARKVSGTQGTQMHTVWLFR